jgi:hypothetical protein
MIELSTYYIIFHDLAKWKRIFIYKKVVFILTKFKLDITSAFFLSPLLITQLQYRFTLKGGKQRPNPGKE